MQIDSYKLHSGGFTFFVICIVVLFLASSFLIAFIYRPEKFQKTRMNVFFKTLASIAIVLVGINIIMSALALENNQKFARISKTKEIVDKLWLYPNSLITKSTHARPIFLASFYLNNPQLYEITAARKVDSELTTKMILEEQYISLVMIQAWEDALTMQDYDDTGIRSWIRAFLVWAQNPYLKEYFKKLNQSYRNTTIKFGELLFEYADTIPRPNTDNSIYAEITLRMMKDPRLIKLLDETNN